MFKAGFFERQGARVQTLLPGVGATAVIYPAAFLTALGEGTLSLGIIFLMRDAYAATPSLVGWLMSSGTLVYALGCLFVRPLFAGLRPRFLMLMAAGGITVSLSLLYALREVPLTFLFFGMSKLSASFFWPPAIGWLSENREGRTLNRVLSRFNLSWSLGLMLSLPLAGWLSDQDLEYPILGTIAAQAAAFLLIAGAALALPAAHRRQGAGRQRASPRDHGERRDHSTPLRFTAWAGMFAGYIAAAAIVTLFPQYARDSLGASKTVVGNLLSLRMLARAVSFFLLGTLSFWHHRGRYQLATSALLMVVMLVMTRLRTLLPFAVLIPVFAVGNAFVYAGSLFHGVAGSANRAARTAIHEALVAGGYIVGASVGGLLYQHASFQTALWFCALCLLAALAAQAAVLAGIQTGFGRGARRNALL